MVDCALPGSAGRLLIAGLATLLIGAALLTVCEGGVGEGGALRSAGCALLMFGALMPCYLDEVYVMPVLWAGVLIGLSVCAYGLGSWRWGCAAGLAALFLRDLSAGYCLLCVVLALWERRWREVAVWALGLLAYTGFFAIHAAQVHALQGAHEVAHEGSWFQFGGAGFVLSTAQMNAYLLIAPQWLTALFFVASLMGLAAWNSPTGRRVGLTACGYIAGFAVIGHPFNQYWGSLIAPLLCFGVAWFPRAAQRLWSDCRWPPLLAGAAKQS